MATPRSTQKAEKKEKEYSALQDWMCSVGEPTSSLIVSGILGALVVAIALLMRALF